MAVDAKSKEVILHQLASRSSYCITFQKVWRYPLHQKLRIMIVRYFLMKRRLMLAAMSLILTVTLSVTSMNTVAEASPKMSPTEENLEITINSFLESDGAVAEELTDEMLKTFLETPLDFLRVIDTYPLDKQELLLSRIANVAVGMPDEERLSFEDIIYSADETTPGISLLETYYSEALEATPPQNSVSNLPKYDMESVNQIVKAYLASDSEGNEAFYNYLSNVYSAEPELMESVMMNYSDSEIQTLAKDLCQYYFFARRYIYHKSCSLQWLSFIGNSLWSKSRRILRELENNCNF